jgi:hypothetical protein
MSMFGPMGQPFIVGSAGDFIPETYGYTSTGDAILTPSNHLGETIPYEMAYLTPTGEQDLSRFDSSGNPTRFWAQQPSPAAQAAQALQAMQMRQAAQPGQHGLSLQEVAALL